tara:strand:- start:8 stop:544 length:537 start_codon:yes stop_codon:yes gene_type:complete
MNIQYNTYCKTYVKKSNIKGAGLGLFLGEKLEKYDWIGLYPGIMDKIEKINGDPVYIMGTRKPGIVISADGNIKRGVHLVNEGNNNNLPNVFYVKLYSGKCLYFAGRNIKKNEELITCYSCSYGNRPYAITDSNKCTDPRCKIMNNSIGTHRNNSFFYRGWKKKLKEKKPKKVKDVYI